MKKNCLILFFLLLISCAKEIKIEIPERRPKLVVNSTLVPFTLPRPKSLYLDIQSSAPIFDTTKNLAITDAMVLMYSNGKFLDTIHYVDSLKTYPIRSNLIPVAGDNLTVKVSANGYENVSASTTIPSKVMITNTTVRPFAYLGETDNPYTELKITFTDPANEVNFYELAVSSIAFTNYDKPVEYYELVTADELITSESYYPSLIKFDSDKPKFLLFKDKKINGQQHTLTVYYPSNYDPVSGYIHDHLIIIHLRNVTEEYYRFKTTMIQHLFIRGEDIIYGASEPLGVFSNIENGYGIFAGFNNDMVSLQVKKTKYK